jgi:hypothetical protein
MNGRQLKIPLSGIGWYLDLSSLCYPIWVSAIAFSEVVFSKFHVGNPAKSRWQGFIFLRLPNNPTPF